MLALWNTRQISIVGLMTAILCLLGPWVIMLPFSPIPISLCTLGIYFGVIISGTKSGTLSTLLYLLLGFVGLPVFSGFMGGPSKLLGPTGGYLLGYILMALICGVSYAKFKNRLGLCLASMFAGTCVCYAFGTIWLAYQLSLPLTEAFLIGTLPYMPGDIAKLIFANTVGTKLQRTLKKAGLIP